jgi:hypothetical protein
MRNQCCACGRLFGGVTAFDRHRTGDFEPGTKNPRRCRTDAEMAKVRITLQPGGYYGMPVSGKVAASVEG